MMNTFTKMTNAQVVTTWVKKTFGKTVERQVMPIAEQIDEKVRALPDELAREVLDFVCLIKTKYALKSASEQGLPSTKRRARTPGSAVGKMKVLVEDEEHLNDVQDYVAMLKPPVQIDDHLIETFGSLEQDPSGLAQNAPGAKLDAYKPRSWLVLGGFANALQAVAEVGTFGANKYTADGWKQVDNGFSRYSDAMLRHVLAEAAGDELDPESSLLHAAHGAWNALARLELLLAKKRSFK
jgi:hypothetical protein